MIEGKRYFCEFFNIFSVVWTEASETFNFGRVLSRRLLDNSWIFFKIRLKAFTADNVAQKVLSTEKTGIIWIYFEIGVFGLFKNFAEALWVFVDSAREKEAIIQKTEVYEYLSMRLWKVLELLVRPIGMRSHLSDSIGVPSAL